MRLFNAARAEIAAEDNAAAMRLNAIRGRHTTAPSLYAVASEPPEAAEPQQEAEPAWMPEEIAAEDDFEQPE